MEQLIDAPSATLEDLSIDDIFSALENFEQEANNLSRADRAYQLTVASQDAEQAAVDAGDKGDTLVREVEIFLQSDQAQELAVLQIGIRDRIASGDLCCDPKEPATTELIKTGGITNQAHAGGGGRTNGVQSYLSDRRNNKQKTKKKPGGWCAGLIALLCFVDLS